mmetsp:Transcript_39115/g.103454  ORF Transcript_39115/g.103454 Transcript_39115/m.103454 type:complete len:94 (-) Transcript_39115:753-1034(-)
MQKASELDGKALRMKAMLLAPRRILSRIANLYARKILMDQVDDRAGKPRQHMATFLWEMMLLECDSPAKALSSLVTFLGNILAFTDPPHLAGW